MKTADPVTKLNTSLHEVAESSRAVAQEKIDQGLEKVKEARACLSSRIEKNPIASVAIAALVGVALGKLVFRR
jgi:ElaB/YqjD/DUF883 family membrane-anchored ribosome-binding protein